MGLDDVADLFGEELIIIQKEFDGFNDTKERLDLLALDKKGRLVVNKLDNGQLEVAPAKGAKVTVAAPARDAAPGAESDDSRDAREGREGRGGRRGRRGGRGRNRRDRDEAPLGSTAERVAVVAPALDAPPAAAPVA